MRERQVKTRQWCVALRKIARATALAGVLLSGCGGGAPTSPPSPSPTPLPPAVLILTIDGLRPDAMALVQPPNLLAFAARGAHTMAAHTVVPPNTLPAHASLISGVDPSVHGITWGDYQPARGTIAVPTLFTIAHSAGLRTALVCGKNVFRQVETPGAIDFFADLGDGDPVVATEAIARLGQGYRLMLVHLADVDLTGHRSGWMSDAYLRQIGETDAAVGRLLAAVPAGTTVIFTSDHGGIGRDHLTTQPLDTTIPWMIAGPRVAAGRVLVQPVDIKDTAATALRVLGLPLPAGIPSRPVAEAFVP
jgi:predicted AlkP superfamily pyrophosphatase or phosphodiesterase